MKTIHLVFNAHIDPIWLWPWQAGLDEALATCRSACDRLDRHPDVIFTRGEAWIYEQIERIDPELFSRIKTHVKSGQWEVVGGWWIQPDCNLPSEWAMEKQIALGKSYFLDRFGFCPKTAYNVDTFGHSSAIPGLIRGADQDSYIMMRPGPSEMELPSRLFRWRGSEQGPEVLTCRISGYITNTEMSVDYLQRCTEQLPDGIDQAICFAGIGDHGGGPTESQIAWCRENRLAVPGWELVFSSPIRFFDAVRPLSDLLPVVIGELQPHAVGCYSAYRQIKFSVRSAEHLLQQAESISSTEDAGNLEEAWKRVCFHHFHDTLGGTCLPSAYPIILDQLGLARTVADEVLQYGLRKKMVKLPDDPLQRIVLYNASETPFDDFIEFEPWVDWWQPWLPDCGLIDADGVRVPVQTMQSEALARFGENGSFSRILFRASLAPKQLAVLRIVRDIEDLALPSVVRSSADGTLHNGNGLTISSAGPTWRSFETNPTFRLELTDDPSDTWGHDVIGFVEEPAEHASWQEPRSIDTGPLMASLSIDGVVGSSSLHAEWRTYSGERFADLNLRVLFTERHKILKMTIAYPDFGQQRVDGVMGSHLSRSNNGAERPLRDWTLLSTTDGNFVGIVSPDVYGVDATEKRVRLTLLRSPLMAHHLPVDASDAARGIFGDQGVHNFRFRFFFGDNIDPKLLDKHALALQRPPVAADLTRGMPADFRSHVKRTIEG